METKNYGLRFEETKPEDYQFGGEKSSLFGVINESGQWRDYLPEGELQRKGGIETNSCVTFGTLNMLEMLLDKLFYLKTNYSERYTAIVSGTSGAGNSPKAVSQSIRDYGLLEDYKLPFNPATSYDLFFSPKPMTQQYINDGKLWTGDFDYRYEFIFNTLNGGVKDRQAKLMEALKSSPVGISVYAWKFDNERNLYIKPEDTQCNHWVVLIGYKENEYWEIYDSYSNPDGFIKKLDWNFDFSVAIRAKIEERILTEIQSNYFMDWLNKLLIAFGIIKKNADEVLKEIQVENPSKTDVPKASRITDWAEAIAEYENMGKYHKELNNPGAIKGLDGKFLNFVTYEAGFDYLCNYLTRACKGLHRAYKPDFSLLQFFNVYAPSYDKNKPDIYAKFVANKLKVAIDIKIKELL